MAIMLGNMTVAQIEERCGVKFSKDDEDFLNKTHQSKANNIENGKWHCFDMPFMIVCGGRDFFNELFERLKKYGKDMKCALQIGCE